MTEMSKKQLESMRERFPKGTRIQCLEHKDGAAIPTGEEGTLDYISETGLFHCDLDDGRRFIVAISEGSFRVIPTITEVNKDTFWTLIAQAKEECGQDMDASTQWLIDRLVEMGPEQALSFDNIVHSYRDLAYKYGLWSAASVLCDGCTDDGFIDFRGWLIAQGREVYMAALKDPDSLADVPAYGGCCFESLSYVGDYAYEKLTGQDSYDRFDRNAYQRLVEELKKDVVYGEGIDYPYTWSETAAYLPRLCAKHMTPEELAWRINCHNDTWNITSPDIRSARATAQKSKKIKKDRGESR